MSFHLSVLKTPFNLNPSSFNHHLSTIIFQPSSTFKLFSLLLNKRNWYYWHGYFISLKKKYLFKQNLCIFEYFLIINMDREVPEKAPEDHHHLAMAISNPAPDIFSLALASSSLSVTIINLIFWSKSVATPRLGLSLLKWKEDTGGRNLTRWTLTLTLLRKVIRRFSLSGLGLQITLFSTLGSVLVNP